MKDLYLFLLYIVIIVIIIYFYYYAMNKLLFPYLERKSKGLSSYLLGRIKNLQRTLFNFEILFLLITIFLLLGIIYFLLMGNTTVIVVLMLTYSVLIIFLSSIVIDLKERIGAENYDSVLEKLVNNYNAESYLIKRLSLLLGKTSLGFLIYLLTIYISFIGLVTFSGMPYQAGFVIMLTIPIGLAAWVYLTSFDEISRDLRRILSYFVLLVLSISKVFIDYQVLLKIEKKDPLNDYLIIMILTLFIAIDRLVKSIIDDYKNFKKKLR